MAFRLTGSRKISVDREILNSSVTVSSRDSTRHRNAAEQTLLEQRLRDLDLQRRRSIQAISTEQEKSLLKFLKTKEKNGTALRKTAVRPRENSDKAWNDDTSRPTRYIDLSDTPKETGAQKSPNPNGNKSFRASKIVKHPNKKASEVKIEDCSSIYDAHFNYVPSFLKEEYKREEKIALEQTESVLPGSPQNDTSWASTNLSKKRVSLSNIDPSSFPEQQPKIPTRRRANSLRIDTLPSHRYSLSEYENNSGHNAMETSSDKSNTPLSQRNYSLPGTGEDEFAHINLKPETKLLQHGAFGISRLTGKETIESDGSLTRQETHLARPPNTTAWVSTTATITASNPQGSGSNLLVVPSHDDNMVTYDGIPQHTSTAVSRYLKQPPTSQAPSLCAQELMVLSKSTLISQWNEACSSDDVAQSRRRSICTDRLQYQHAGKSQEKDIEDQCEQLDSFMDQVRRKLALKSSLSKECNEDCRHMEDDVGIEDNPQSRSGGDGVATRRLRNDTMKTKSDALSRKRSKDSDSSRKSSTDLSNKNKVDICNSSNVQGTFRENGRKNGLLDNSRKNSLLDNSRKNSLLDNSRKNSLLDNSRKNSLLDNSRKNSLLDNSRKNSLLDNSRKNSLLDKSRKNSSDAENSGTSSFVQRMNSSKDFMKRDRRDSCKSLDFIDSTDNEGSDAMSEEFTGNNVTEEENQSVLGKTDARIIRERKPPAKILLDASARQLTSCLKRLPEERGSIAFPTEETSAPNSPPSYPDNSYTDMALLPLEPQHAAEEMSLPATPTNIPPRRPSGGGKFFLVASALKSGQQPRKLYFRRDRGRGRSISSIPSDHPCALADYGKRTTSVQRLANAHQLLQNSAMCMVEEEKERRKKHYDDFWLRHA